MIRRSEGGESEPTQGPAGGGAVAACVLGNDGVEKKERNLVGYYLCVNRNNLVCMLTSVMAQ